MVQEEAAVGRVHPIHPAMHTQEEEKQVPIAQEEEEESHQQEDPWR